MTFSDKWEAKYPWGSSGEEYLQGGGGANVQKQVVLDGVHLPWASAIGQPIGQLLSLPSLRGR